MAEMIEKLVAENARTIMNQSDYRIRYEALVKKYNTAKEKYEAVSAEIVSRQNRIIRLNDFIATLRKTSTLLTDFDENLWGALMEYGTVQHDGSITFRFRNGMEINTK